RPGPSAAPREAPGTEARRTPPPPIPPPTRRPHGRRWAPGPGSGGRACRHADRRYPPAPLGPLSLQAPLAQGCPEAGPVLPAGRLPASDRGPQRRQIHLHGGGRRAVAAGGRGRLYARPDPPRRRTLGRRGDLGPARGGGL